MAASILSIALLAGIGVGVTRFTGASPSPDDGTAAPGDPEGTDTAVDDEPDDERRPVESASPEATDAYDPPVLPGPTCPSIPHGDEMWEAIDPDCVVIRDPSRPPHRWKNYGAQAIAVAPSAPHVLVLGTNYQGLWRSTDRGDTWTQMATTNDDLPDDCNTFDGRNWTIAIDPRDPDVIYTANGFSNCAEGREGLWRTTDGGVTWRQAIPDHVMDVTTRDPYTVAFDPWDSDHILVGSHGLWGVGTGNTRPSGVLESTDGGATWNIIEAAGAWGTGHYVHFMDDSDTWLVGTQDDGLWRTTDGGDSWQQVSDLSITHGMHQLHRTDDGTWYTTVRYFVLRSDDGGASWTTIFEAPCSNGFGGIIGDGTRLYVAPANVDGAYCEPVSYYSAPLDDDTDWRPFGSQTFANGPFNFAIDPTTRTIYSSNWAAGVYRLSY